MMRALFFSISLSLLSAFPAFAQAKKKATPKVSNAYSRQLDAALAQVRSGQHAQAANNLYSLSRRPELAAERAQIKYALGVSLMELNLPQVAAFQFVDVIRSRNPKFAKPAIDKLSVVANELGDDTILDYAISRVNLSDIPPANRDMVYFRIGEIRSKNLDFKGAIESYSRVQKTSPYYYQSLYGRGLALLASNQVDAAISTFDSMKAQLKKAPVTDSNRVIAQLSLARALYQKQDWDGAIKAYSEVPRDTLFWHDALFEQSWAMLRGARFRSALSNFHSLHSAYYDETYNPESLLLRSIVYLYICKYDEMEKVLTLFEKTYGPVSRQLGDFLKASSDPDKYFSEIEKAQAKMSTPARKGATSLPLMISNRVSQEPDVRRGLSYLKRLAEEEARIRNSASFKASPLGQMGLKIIANRVKNTRTALGEKVKTHLTSMRVELRDLYEQAGFIRYEMITGQKEAIKKKISGKDLEGSQIDDQVDREFYVKNGFQYYPFKGEYWLDEIGNFHYLGKSNCE